MPDTPAGMDMAGGRGSSVRGQDPEGSTAKRACTECSRRKVKCVMGKYEGRCKSCSERDTECTVRDRRRVGNRKRRADGTPASRNQQVPPNINDDPNHIDRAGHMGWHGGLLYRPNLQPVPTGSVPSSSTATHPPLRPNQHMTLPNQVAPSGGNHVLPLGCSRSNSDDTSATMSRTSSYQSARDIQQSFDPNQTILPTPPGTVTISSSSVATQHHQVAAPAMVSHTAAAAPGNPPPHNAPQQPPTAIPPGFDGTQSRQCFTNCATVLVALRETKPDSVPKKLKVSAAAIHACLRLLNCPLCKRSIDVATVSVVGSVIDEVSSTYTRMLGALQYDNGVAPPPGPGGRSELQQQLGRCVARLRDLHLGFITMCSNLAEGGVVAAAYIDHVNARMAGIDARSSVPAQQQQTVQAVDFAAGNGLGFGPGFFG